MMEHEPWSAFESLIFVHCMCEGDKKEVILDELDLLNQPPLTLLKFVFYLVCDQDY